MSTLRVTAYNRMYEPNPITEDFIPFSTDREAQMWILFNHCNDILLSKNPTVFANVDIFTGQNKYNNMFNYEKTIKLSVYFRVWV